MTELHHAAATGHDFAYPAKPRRALSWRWLPVLAASAVLHLLLVDWAGARIGLPSMAVREAPPVIAQLHALPAAPVSAPDPVPVPAPAAAARPVAKPKARPRPRPAAPARKAAPAIAQAAPVTPAAPVMSAPQSSTPEAMPDQAALPDNPIGSATDFPAARASADATPDDPVAPAAPAAKEPYRIALPPSAELSYDVQALRDGKTVHGTGRIQWRSDGSRYTLDGEAGVRILAFIPVLNFRSAGVLDGFGVSPVLYSEKRFRRAETNTHFHRERNTISFSASTAVYPRQGGEQDRASIAWQLSGLGRGSGERFAAGETIEFFVAGVRDAEVWQMRIVGQENIETGSGNLSAWHVARVPRPGSYDQKLDIWLAPQQNWYPVKLRFTETNGDYLDMSLSGLVLDTPR